ncbi:MAG: DEAD/DEAH box helicase [Treponema sp.]|jgi:ATP-dependent RNA helicase RhlB|nr:DEAD/DEAH box helicase [Treponema sp.]
MKFIDFKLHPDLQKGIDRAGYIDCMPVQEQVLLNAFSGHDLYVQSQTGTGKTAAFLTVVFQRMLTEDLLSKRKALIMAPTRELAVQIEEEAKLLGNHLPFKTGSFYGGVGYAQQEKLLRENVQILVGTPGRVLDLNKSGKMNLMDVTFLVLDEADRMFDMGFYPDLRKLIKVVPAVDRRQTMLFSATLNAWVKNLAWEYTKAPIEIEIKPETVTVDEVSQVLYHVSSDKKMQLLLGILKHEQPESAIIFCNTKKHTEIIAKRLRMNGIPCEFIIGDLPQVKRLKVIDNVKNGKIKILIATDVAARGLDIENLAMVINYDVPNEAENYVHRIGRTARAGKTGKAITLASEHDVYELPAIERYIGKKVPSEIAAQELFAGDESAHLRVQTDYYEERNIRDKSPRKSSPREKDRGARQDTRQTFGSKPQREKGNKRRQEEKQNRSGSSAQRISSEALQDMSNLSMEERMAIYKKRYAQAADTRRIESGRRTTNLPTEGKHTKAGSGKVENKKRRTKHRKHDVKPLVEKPKPQEASAKKGFFSKLFRMFKN